MAEFTTEELIQYAAGDLTPDRLQEIERQIPTDGELAARVCLIEYGATADLNLPELEELTNLSAVRSDKQPASKHSWPWSRVAATILISAASFAVAYAAPKVHELLTSERIPLVNPGFEEGLKGWEKASGIDSDKAKATTAKHKTGKAALELKYGPTGGSVVQHVKHPIPHGKQVKITAWVLMPEAGSRRNKILGFEIQGFDPVRKERWNVASFHNLTFVGPYPEWTRLEFAPGNLAPSDDFRILIHTGNGDGNGPAHSVFVDDVEVVVLNQ